MHCNSVIKRNVQVGYYGKDHFTVAIQPKTKTFLMFPVFGESKQLTLSV